MASKKTRRSTVRVEWLREKANLFFKNSKDSQKAERLGVASLLELTLQETGNYKGFNYIGWMEGGSYRWRQAGEPKDNTPYLGDQTRRIYF